MISVLVRRSRAFGEIIIAYVYYCVLECDIVEFTRQVPAFQKMYLIPHSLGYK